MAFRFCILHLKQRWDDQDDSLILIKCAKCQDNILTYASGYQDDKKLHHISQCPISGVQKKQMNIFLQEIFF